MFDRTIRIVQPLFIVLSAIFITLLLWQKWPELIAYPWRLNPTWFLLATGLLLITWAIEIAIWHELLGVVGGSISFTAAVRIWFLSAVTRYIPGNIWQPLSMTLYCQRRGVRPEATITSIVLFQTVILLAVTPFAATYFLVGDSIPLPTLNTGTTTLALMILLAPVMFFLLRPSWLFAILNWGLGKFGRAPLTVTISSGKLATLLLIAVIDWLLWGATFAAFAFSLREFSPDQMWSLAPHFIASFPIAYAIGFLSVITPSGLGVREGVLVLLLMTHVDAAFIAILALGMRVWTTVGELLIAGASLLPEQRSHRPPLDLAGIDSPLPPLPASKIAAADPAIDADFRSKPT